MNNQLRYGRFTSSCAVNLMQKSRDGKGFGKPALTYIKEKAMERRLGRSLDTETNGKALQWGKCVESIPFELLGSEYSLNSTETIVHPKFPYISGTPDMIKHTPKKAVCDIKCPYTLKSFCTFIDSWKIGGIDEIRAEHQDGDKYYWQLVQNAILTECNEAELIIYMPYESELEKVNEQAEKWGYQWIVFAMDNDLPFIYNDGYYKNLNVMPFTIPQSDIDRLLVNIHNAESIIGEALR